MAHASKAVVLALILFFFVYTLCYLYCLPCSFLCSVTSCFLHAFTLGKLIWLACSLCAVGLISLSCKGSRHVQPTVCSQLDNSLSHLFYFELSAWLSLNGHNLVILRQLTINPDTDIIACTHPCGFLSQFSPPPLP